MTTSQLELQLRENKDMGVNTGSVNNKAPIRRLYNILKGCFTIRRHRSYFPNRQVCRLLLYG
jgi:hypothetical protein